MVENLAHILQTSYVKEFLSLMQKFEVVLLLDENRLLIPSLLPSTEQQACLVFSKQVSAGLTNKDEGMIDQISSEPHAPLCQTPYPVLARYYLLPFIPNGFFTRVTARLMSSDIVDHLQRSIVSESIDSHNIMNGAHWKCWRDGIIITWNHMEIFRIAPITFPLPGTSDTHLISSEGGKPGGDLQRSGDQHRCAARRCLGKVQHLSGRRRFCVLSRVVHGDVASPSSHHHHRLGL